MDYLELSTELQQLITPEQAWHYGIVPKQNGSCLSFYVGGNHLSPNLADELELLFGKNIKLEITDADLIKKTLGRYYRKGIDHKAKNKVSKEICHSEAEDFLGNIIGEAHGIASSDIHIECYEDVCRVRFRIDGKLIERYKINATEYPALVNKIKIKANLDIAEKRLPQDGRIFFESGHEQFDIRVSSLPTLYGEKVVMRLLSRDATQIDINRLGFSKEQLIDYQECIRKTSGIILISGPTGSGKTTTLYATLKILNSDDTNILTIEDPIEYTLKGINQVQLKESIGLTFTSALRTFLRQDPDIIMLGEIRDAQTAQMAIRAALTGHLVLSTVHTNSAWGTITRLIDMGVPAFLLADTLNMSVAQRLVRLLCPKCKKEEKIDVNLFPAGSDIEKHIKKNYVSVGCENCYYTGFKGRKAVFEVIPVDRKLSACIREGAYDVKNILKEKKTRTMRDIAVEIVNNGETSISEVYSMIVGEGR